MHRSPTPPGPPGADVPPTIPTQTPQNAEAGTHTGTGLRADVQRRQGQPGPGHRPGDQSPIGPRCVIDPTDAPPWRALLACGHRVDVVQVSPGAAEPPTTVECPRCGARQAVDVYPLTALSDPENVGWQPVEDDR